MKLLKNLGITTVIGALLITTAQATAGPGVVRPWDGSNSGAAAGRSASFHQSPLVLSSVASADLQAGADHIVAQQCPNGGFGWPHNNCSATFNNITAPICLGLLTVLPTTGDPAHLAAAVAGGDFDLTSAYANGESRFGAFTPDFLMALSVANGDPQYSTFTATKFFDELNAATYGPSDLDTAGWIAAVQTNRTGTWENLRPWEFHTLITTARAIGNPGQDALFLQALLDGLNTLDNTSPATVYSDLIGLAGGVRGLALSGTVTFPAINSPNHAPINGIDNLNQLANVLLGFQNPDGSWYWHSDLSSFGGATEGDKDTQTTAYAVLALIAANPLVATDYSSAINAGRSFLGSMQVAGGGFLSWPGGSENTEVEGEALTALAAGGIGGAQGPVPAVSQWGLVILALTLVILGKVYFSRRRQAAL